MDFEIECKTQQCISFNADEFRFVFSQTHEHTKKQIKRVIDHLFISLKDLRIKIKTSQQQCKK